MDAAPCVWLVQPRASPLAPRRASQPLPPMAPIRGNSAACACPAPILSLVGVIIEAPVATGPFASQTITTIVIAHVRRRSAYCAPRGARPERHYPHPRADPGFARNPDYRGQGLYLAFTAEDKDVFTTPWSAAITYQRPLGDWSEMVCAETLDDRFTGKAVALPHADKPDF